MEFVVQGKLVSKGEKYKVSESFQKVVFVLEVDGDTDYPQLVEFEAHNKATSKILDKNQGDFLELKVNLRGRKWYDEKKDKVVHFNTLVAWFITKIEEPKTTTPPQDTSDDLPF